MAHHQCGLSQKEYEDLINKFEEVLLWALARQVDIHDQIDEFFSQSESGRNSEK